MQVLCFQEQDEQPYCEEPEVIKIETDSEPEIILVRARLFFSWHSSICLVRLKLLAGDSIIFQPKSFLKRFNYKKEPCRWVR